MRVERRVKRRVEMREKLRVKRKEERRVEMRNIGHDDSVRTCTASARYIDSRETSNRGQHYLS